MVIRYTETKPSSPASDVVEEAFKKDFLKHVPDALKPTAFKKHNGVFVHTCTRISFEVYKELWNRKSLDKD